LGEEALNQRKHFSATSSVANLTPHRGFGIAWITFALAAAVHVTDEATHDFLSIYNSSVHSMRERLPLLPLPTFSFRIWLSLLIAGILLLLCLSPLAFRGNAWLRIASRPLGLVIGGLNASLHIGSSIYFERWMPGVYSSPLLLLAGLYLLANSSVTSVSPKSDDPFSVSAAP
jgi:hypothetical protein